MSPDLSRLNPDWIIPNWPAPAHVRAVCTTRAGGVSHAPFDSMNFGDHVGDDARHVAHNRALLKDAIQAVPVFLNQVHGVQVIEHGPAETAISLEASEVDACITRHAGMACTIMVADCLPVLFANRQGTVVGAAHAGWRGLAGEGGSGVLESSVQQLRISDRQDTLVWLGPCIGPDKFEVGDEVRDTFVAHDSGAQAMFKPCGPGKWLADLAGLARLRLRAMGIEAIYGHDGNDGSRDWCTVSNPSRFFSHRRDARSLGGSGRMAACIWLG